MYIRINEHNTNIVDAILDDTINSCTIVATDLYNSTHKLYITKIKTGSNLDILTYARPTRCNKDTYIFDIDTIADDILLAYDNVCKCILISGSTMLKYQSLVQHLRDNMPDYDIYDADEEYFKIAELYEKELNAKLDSNFNEFMKDSRYANMYKIHLEECEKSIEIQYIHSIDFENKYLISFSMPEVLDLCSYDTVINYINNNDVLKPYIEQHYNEVVHNTVLLLEHARNMAAIKVLNTIIDNLPHHLIEAKKIVESIKQAGKTFNAKLKDGRIVKVTNKLVMGTEFRDYLNDTYISIWDIDEITFAKKVIYKREEVA